MLGFFLGLIVSALFLMCLFLECGNVVRCVFSIFFLAGIFGLIFLIFTAGLLLTPFFIGGVMVNLLFFLVFLPVIMSSDKKEKK